MQRKAGRRVGAESWAGRAQSGQGGKGHLVCDAGLKGSWGGGWDVLRSAGCPGVKKTTVSFPECSPGSGMAGGRAEGEDSGRTSLGSHPRAAASLGTSVNLLAPPFSHLQNWGADPRIADLAGLCAGLGKIILLTEFLLVG